MSDKLPQPTSVLIKRLRRAAKGLRDMASESEGAVFLSAWANTCDQAAARMIVTQHDKDECPCIDCRGPE